MNVVPLTSLPINCIGSGSADQTALRSLRKKAVLRDGYFLLRYHNLMTPSGTFNLKGDMRYEGRWLLGRIRRHRTLPGQFELLVRRKRTCYYLKVDSQAELCQALRRFDSEADLDLYEALSINSTSLWAITQDKEFELSGF